MVLLIGDLRKEACKKTGAVFDPSCSKNNSMLVSKRKHLSGKNLYQTKVQFSGGEGSIHDVRIECDPGCGGDDPSLTIRIDSEIVMRIKHLKWKFRGNCRVLVDGAPVEVYWDVHDWLFRSRLGYAVFVFRTRVSTEEKWVDDILPICNLNAMSWSCKDSGVVEDFGFSDFGYCLVLYGCKNE
ncbi:uncharacterized protein LOC127248059 [Andrographis paniculata]|uniref:uncharacterized protein LOC127248059 n=1 Tax=Andrographis paniculata TaxID=175694 RepID=UPI0021E8D515|nr:uncharacterized protein LOC127248059 [Andrographis paniculata]